MSRPWLAVRLFLPFCLLASEAAAQDPDKGATLIKQDVTIRSKSAAGPDVKTPLPGPAPAILQEVLESLEIYKREHPGEFQRVRLSATQRRLSLPFPRPPFLTFTLKKDMDFDWWRFEILSEGQVVWHTAGEGKLWGKLDWDGTGYTGAMAAQAGKPYRWSFTAAQGKERYAVESEDISLKSMVYGEALGTGHMEVSNELVFEPRTAKLGQDAKAYLIPMADKLRASEVGESAYKLTLYHPDPDAARATAWAASLQKFFSQRLVISPARVDVEVRSSRERGEVTDCPIP
ncbi:MAG: hypothetical protein HY924_10325 [Elusimicrobia bacterium]|nr:hypothetical protein [Elusimicrobiota bacterium]